MPVDSRLLQGRVLARRYTVGELVRQTETVSTYRAHHVKGGYDVEIEAVRAGLCSAGDAATQLRSAAHARSRIHHPQVLRPFDIGELADGTPFVVSRCPNGETLSEHVLLHGPLSADDAVQLARDILSALASAHHEHVVHGAFDPDAIVVTREAGVTSLVSVRGFGSPPPDPEYRAPELTRGKSSIAADLYACAGVLFFASTGSSPATKGVFAVPIALSRLIVRATHPEPMHRFESAVDMLRGVGTRHLTRHEEAPIESEIVPVDRALIRDAAAHPAYEQALTGTITRIA